MKIKIIATNKRLFITCFENIVANQDEILDFYFTQYKLFQGNNYPFLKRIFSNALSQIQKNENMV